MNSEELNDTLNRVNAYSNDVDTHVSGVRVALDNCTDPTEPIVRLIELRQTDLAIAAALVSIVDELRDINRAISRIAYGPEDEDA